MDVSTEGEKCYAIEEISEFVGFGLKESIMVDSLEYALSHHYTLNRPVLVRELDCWQGRADIVVACLKEDWHMPKDGGKLISRLSSAQVLSTLYPKRPRKIQDIMVLTGLSETTVKRTIKELIISQIIYEKQSGSYILHPDMKLPKVEFHAFEAKLHNWKRALYQAINYFGFAQYSSVVMPHRYIGAALDNLRDFEINGIITKGTIGQKGNSPRLARTTLDEVELDTIQYNCDHTYSFLRKNERLRYPYCPQPPTRKDEQTEAEYNIEIQQFELRKQYVEGSHTKTSTLRSRTTG